MRDVQLISSLYAASKSSVRFQPLSLFSHSTCSLSLQPMAFVVSMHVVQVSNQRHTQVILQEFSYWISCLFFPLQVLSQPYSQAYSKTGEKVRVGGLGMRLVFKFSQASPNWFHTLQLFHTHRKPSYELGIRMRIVCLTPSTWKVQSAENIMAKLVAQSRRHCPLHILFTGQRAKQIAWVLTCNASPVTIILLSFIFLLIS